MIYTRPIVNWIGGLVEWVATRPISPALRKLVIGLVCRILKINPKSAEFPIETYGSIQAWFTRSIRPDLRPISTEPETISSPVDGKILDSGRFTQNQQIYVKGSPYFIPDLIHPDVHEFSTGSFSSIYLSPADCHRIMSPVDGVVEHLFWVPGDNYPVKPEWVEKRPKLYIQNRRLVLRARCSEGLLFMVMVGATNVGNITSPLVQSFPTDPNCPEQRPVNTSVRKGQWIGTFFLGSTVVLISDFRVDWELANNCPVLFGGKIGKFSTHD
jgi:phosphatidylserine decarboxylase